MPTEFRFEDLDLREEPSRSLSEENDIYYPTLYCTAQTRNCNRTKNCTVVCCTDAC